MSTEKEVELEHLIDFCRAADIHFDSITLSESPDIICDLDGKKIGVEMTIATHPGTEKFGALAIEGAQSDFAKELKNAIGSQAGVIIGISFEDGVPVTKEDKIGILDLADLIKGQAEKLGNPDAITLWAEKTDWSKLGKERRLTAPLPAFVQNICLFKDGQHGTKIGGGRGGIVPDFDDGILHPILASKNKRLVGYQECDERWLVIVSSVQKMEKHSPRDEASSFGMASFATCFGAVNVSTPIPSDFDATYLFKWPTDVKKL